MDKRFLEDCLGEGKSLAAIGRQLGKDASTVGYWVKKHGLQANGASKYAPRGGIVEEVLEIATDEGMTTSEIAEELGRSESTVRYWLRICGLSPNRAEPRHSRQFADPLGTRKTKECRRHGTTEFVMEGRGYYRCIKCRSQAVAKRRRVVKQILVEEAGGCCAICGYAGSLSALEFHHLDPSQKLFPLSVRGRTTGIARLRAEARKCVLLCATCHAEVEAGDRVLSVKLASAAS